MFLDVAGPANVFGTEISIEALGGIVLFSIAGIFILGVLLVREIVLIKNNKDRKKGKAIVLFCCFVLLICSFIICGISLGRSKGGGAVRNVNTNWE